MSGPMSDGARRVREACQCKKIDFDAAREAIGAATEAELNHIHLGYSPLVLAVLSPAHEEDSERLVSMLLSGGAKPDDVQRDAFESLSPLSAALSCERLRCAEVLLAAGARVDAPNMWGRTPLYMACVRNSVDGVKCLLAHGLELSRCLPEALEEASGRSMQLLAFLLLIACERGLPTNVAVQALCNAAQNGCTENIELLLRHSVPIDGVSPRDGFTPLLYALRAGKASQALLLLDRGARADAKSATGISALQLAVDLGELPVVQRVLNDVQEVVTPTELSSMLVLATRRRRLAVVERLLAAGADATFPDEVGRYPLHEAVRGRRVEIVRVLLEAGAYVDARDRTGQSPLHIYAQWQAIPRDVALCLLHGGANTALQDRYERTPLHYAAQRAHTEAIELLLQYNAPVNACDTKHQPPLFYAVLKNFAHVARSLIEARADVNIPNRSGMRMLDVAEPEVLPHLLHAGAMLGEAPSRPEHIYRMISDYVPHWNTSVHKLLSGEMREVIELVLYIHAIPSCCADGNSLTLVPTELLHLIIEDVVALEAQERVSAMLSTLWASIPAQLRQKTSTASTLE
eukprot:TRINITY_DN3367_c0_g1_i1.p1 TRINITY_DN3367_c0_g1~~TRINITY_DN3367_c0_g1_i1.p1  ORF type:complete len:575 (+),score=191.20 TRINITY_DN3367_c0_g1_i1:260-1984(+)